MTTFTLQLHIGKNQLPILKDPEAPYTLCIARKVNNEYKVVWKGFKSFSENNLIRWVNRDYQVFASSEFKDGALVNASSNLQSIRFKQRCQLNEFGVMDAAVEDPDAKSGTFKVINKYSGQEAINFGVSGKADSEGSIIYSTPTPVLSGTTLTLAPANEVRVWLSQNDKTSAMILDVEEEYIDVEFVDGMTIAKISYEGEEPGRAAWWKKIPIRDANTFQSR
ncbi:hypothetical protein GYMLUDRAFT_947706 [Collybiopsis luxurians FD-317 M1]|uniref:Unplaced genomic scaffold GYMLUscaffold_88, whole genome shotgun sequence n=1 Tax=Collybiopsis luxurians FD-317 M1 TaxID=944289 RepID=A0A0D0AR73_9AGAR|nr:hypothetical protein GYMLUDRAFT_947706 [Collybiopsis luxurians FD-317 M1]